MASVTNILRDDPWQLFKFIPGKWYIFVNKNKGEKSCAACRNRAEYPILYKKGDIYPHPNCACEIKEYSAEMRTKLREKMFEDNPELLDILLQKEYYKYDDIALPFEIVGDYYYYSLPGGQIIRVKLGDLLGMAVLPDGSIIIGEGQEDWEYKYLMYKKLMTYYEYCETPLPGDIMRGLEEALFSEVREFIAKRYPGEKSEKLEKLFNSWKNTPCDYYELTDATKKFNQIIEGYVNDKKWSKYRNNNPIDVIIDAPYNIATPEVLNQKELFDKAMGLPSLSINLLEKYLSFYSETRPYGPADLKVNSDWIKHSTYLYNGEVVDLDAFGNILYGWLGKYSRIPDNTLFDFAAIFQDIVMLKNDLSHIFEMIDFNLDIYDAYFKINFNDDPRDTYWVQQGIDLYNSFKWQDYQK